MWCHTALPRYVVENKAFPLATAEAAPLLLDLIRARAALASGISSSLRLSTQGPRGRGCAAGTSPLSIALRSALALTPANAAASFRLSHPSPCLFSLEWQGIPLLHRNEVTRTRVHRLPLPVRMPLALREAAITSSVHTRARVRIASMTSGLVAAWVRPVGRLPTCTSV